MLWGLNKIIYITFLGTAVGTCKCLINIGVVLVVIVVIVVIWRDSAGYFLVALKWIICFGRSGHLTIKTTRISFLGITNLQSKILLFLGYDLQTEPQVQAI